MKVKRVVGAAGEKQLSAAAHKNKPSVLLKNFF
jgi:hypothetical protein